MIKRAEFYHILTFPTTTDALYAEKCAKGSITAALVPIPSGLSNGCGLALRFVNIPIADILNFCTENHIQGSLYKMELQKKDGKHPILMISTFS